MIIIRQISGIQEKENLTNILEICPKIGVLLIFRYLFINFYTKNLDIQDKSML